MLAAELFVIAPFTPTRHLFTANFSQTDDTRCACTRVHNGPHLGSLVPRPTPAGLWGTARPMTTRPARSHHRPGLPGRPTRAAPTCAPDGGTTAAAARPPCARRAAASASRARLRCCPTRQRGRRPPACSHSDLHLLQRPDRPPRWPSGSARQRQRSGPCIDLYACGTW